MSFSAQVKNEILANTALLKNHRVELCYGLLLCSRYFGSDRMSIGTERKQIAELYRDFLVGLELTAEPRIVQTGAGLHTGYGVSVDSAEDRDKILEFFGHIDNDINTELLDGEGGMAFFSGAYLACGTVTDPSRNYLLEFTVYNRELIEPLANVFGGIVGYPKFAMKRGVGVLYYRESENIEDALTAMGASKASLDLMELKIVREIRNKVNRVTNCETANIDKTVAAAAVQTESIKLLISSLGEEGLPQELKEIALLRLEHPEMSLSVLAASLSTTISRSGANHRLKRLCDMAEELKEKSGQQ